MRLTVVALLAFLFVCSTASATLIVSVDPGIDAGNGLMAYVVHLVSDNDTDRVTAWEGAVSGSVHQVWNQGWDVSATMGRLGPSPQFRPMYGASTLTAALRLQDSHILAYDPSLLSSENFGMPSEDNDLSSPDGVSGFGNMYGGTPGTVMGFGYGSFVRDLSLIQIVVPVGQLAYLTGSAVNATGIRTPTIQTIGVPEPATMSLLAVGAVGMLIKRRRSRQ